MLQPSFLAIRPSAGARAPLPTGLIAPRPVDGPSNDHHGIGSIRMAADRQAGSPTSQSSPASAAEPPWMIGDGVDSCQRFGCRDPLGG